MADGKCYKCGGGALYRVGELLFCKEHRASASRASEERLRAAMSAHAVEHETDTWSKWTRSGRKKDGHTPQFHG